MRSAVAVVGLALLAAGCSWAWPPLGPIVSGAALLAGAVWGHVRDGKAAAGEGDDKPNGGATDGPAQ